MLLAVPLWFLMRSALKALFVRIPAPQGQEIKSVQAPELCTTPAEALAVVAHEYGHLAGAHGRFGSFIYRLRLSWATIEALAQRWGGIFGRALGRTVAWYAPYFNAYTFVLARANEHEADRCPADMVGAAIAADALKRVNVASARYQAFLGDTFGAVACSANPSADLPARWAALAGEVPPSAQRWLDEALDRECQVTDTHPPLRQRLAALDAGAAGALPPGVTGASAAQAWVGAMLPGLRASFASRI